MKKKLKIIIIPSLSVAVAGLMTVTSAFAQSGSVSSPVSIPISTTGRVLGGRHNGVASSTVIANLEGSSTLEIDNRITSLNNLITRVQDMVKLPSTEKANLVNTLQAVVADMTTLKAKISADTTPASIKADFQSITKDYRVYALVLPQGRIAAASDRIETIVSMFSQISTKLQTRITDAGNAGHNTTSVSSTLADLNAKTSDASAQAQAAVSETANLQPDQGSKTVAASNQATLKDAASKIKVATQDIVSARLDVKTILNFLKSVEGNSATSSNQ